MKYWFQFHYGSIISNSSPSSVCELILFQFHYGSIIRYGLWFNSNIVSNFNSTMVQLLVAGAGTALSPLTYFNSTMVQLLGKFNTKYNRSNRFQFHYGSIIRRLAPDLKPVSSWFQFHYGSIISEYLKSSFLRLQIFQFHYGSIISFFCRLWIQPDINFNSTMVQLLEDTIIPESESFYYFNSTMVQLLVRVRDIIDSSHPYFNSTMVQLLVL